MSTTVIEIDVHRCTSSEQSCIVCGKTSIRPIAPPLLRLNTYLKRHFYIPNKVRCCKDHYKYNNFLDDCFNRINTVEATSKIPIVDLNMFLSDSTKKSRKCGVLDSFNDKSVTDANCNSITGLKKGDFYSLVALLTSMRNSKNRTIIEAVVIFLTRL